jgi:cytokinin dehydrogenase
MTTINKFTRRKFLSGVVAGAVVVGFDPFRRLWVTEASASVCDFSGLPLLEGVLFTDTATRSTDSSDNGNIIHQTPCAVLRTASVQDIKKMIRFCREHHIKVAVRGQGHTTHGQGLTTGLVIENEFLNKVHSIGPEGADVDAGVRWKDLVTATVAQGLTPPVLTGFTQLSVGGTLSVGGISPGYNAGAQVDHVQKLEVVTGRGDILECSDRQRPQLFEAVLAGLGQCGVITRATIDLIPAKQMARKYNLNYTDNAVFFQDFRTLLSRGEIPHIFNIWLPDGIGGWVYQIQATVFYDTIAPQTMIFYCAV